MNTCGLPSDSRSIRQNNHIPTLLMDLPKLLADTLTQFNAASLADGNLLAGTNILTAMCCTLANILPHGAGFRSPDGDILPVGLNFLMLDGLSRSLTDSKVFGPMADMQAALIANVNEGNSYEAHHGIGKTIHGKPINPAPSSDIAMNNLRYSLDGFGVKPGDSSPFEILLSPSAESMKGDFKRNPLIFIRLDAGSRPLEKNPSAHLSQPFIRASLDAGSGQSRFVAQLRSIAQGGIGDIALHPRMALSAPPAVFRDLITNGSTDFLSKSIWMFDQPLSANQPKVTGSFPIRQAFDSALRRAWAQRLDFRRTTPPFREFDWKTSQASWVAYLGQKERRFPGISATAYRLFGTLLFGLCRLATNESRLPTPMGAFSLAKHLVERMVSLREQLVQSEERIRLLAIAMRLIPKLADQSCTARELVRKCNRLPIADCRDALQLLSQERIVVQAEQEQWQLALPVPDGLQKIKTAIIEI